MQAPEHHIMFKAYRFDCAERASDLLRRIAEGPVRVEINTTLDTDLPGVRFGVAATAFSNEDDSQLEDASITVSLTPNGGFLLPPRAHGSSGRASEILLTPLTAAAQPATSRLPRQLYTGSADGNHKSNLHGVQW